MDKHPTIKIWGIFEDFFNSIRGSKVFKTVFPVEGSKKQGLKIVSIKGFILSLILPALVMKLSQEISAVISQPLFCTK